MPGNCRDHLRKVSCVPSEIESLGAPVDWDMNIVQLRLNQYNFVNYLREKQDKLEIEYEACWAVNFHRLYGTPSKGDLLFVSGRWIIDCGHPDYHAEIHPPAVVAFMRTEQYRGQPATVANIWVNGTYTGDLVEIDIFPPPRPSPTAVLGYSKPKDSEAALDVKIEERGTYNTKVQVCFSASPRKVPVKDGQMMRQNGRGYYGRWYVYWKE